MSIRVYNTTNRISGVFNRNLEGFDVDLPKSSKIGDKRDNVKSSRLMNHNKERELNSLQVSFTYKNLLL